MRKILVSALLATVLIPAAAQAQETNQNRDRGREEHHDRGQGGRDHGRQDGDRQNAGRQDFGRHEGGPREQGRHDGDRRPDGGRFDGRNGPDGRHDAGRPGGFGYERRGGPGFDNRGGRDYRADEWRGWRDGHPGDYRRGGWRAPFGYRSFGIGAVVPRGYWDSRYYVNDWYRFHLPRPGYGYYRYVRHYDDVLLINIRNGRVVRVYRGFYR